MNERFDDKICISEIDTPLGRMRAVGDSQFLYQLAFVDKNYKIKDNSKTSKNKGNVKKTPSIASVEKELQQYFDGKLETFKTPVFLEGTPFQIKVWHALRKLSIGEINAYSDIAKSISKPKAVRAVANAVGANPLCIMIPCHRIIQLNGNIGGYAGGIKRKKWLLNHEGHPEF